MEILRADPADAEALTEIAHAAKRHLGYPEHWIESWRDILTMRPRFIAENVAYCAKDGDRIIGFYLLTTESNGMHLDHLWILPRAMGRGIGRALFQHAIEQAINSGHRAIKVEADPNAAGFYERMGAKRIGVNVTEVEGQPRELPLFLYTVPSEDGEELTGQETSGTHT